jgi:hypothetical protein
MGSKSHGEPPLFPANAPQRTGLHPPCPFCEMFPAETGRISFSDTIDSVFGAERAAYTLFVQIKRYHGLQKARRILTKFGSPPTKRKQVMIANHRLLDRYDMMRPKPNIQRLARQLAKENESLPRNQQRGPGAIDAHALEKQISRQLKLRKIGMEKRTWWGPFPSEN